MALKWISNGVNAILKSSVIKSKGGNEVKVRYGKNVKDVKLETNKSVKLDNNLKEG